MKLIISMVVTFSLFAIITVLPFCNVRRISLATIAAVAL